MEPIIVFIHGFCESEEIWDFVSAEIGTHYETKAVNLPGFGGTSLGEISGITGVADWLKDQLPDNKPMYFVGHSLGGYISLEFLRKYPKRLHGMCLFHSTSRADSEEKKQNRERNIRFIEKNGKEPFLKQFVNSLFAEEFLRQNYGNRQRMDRITLQTPTKVIIEYTRWMKDRPDYVKLLDESELPTLFLCGDQDSFIPAELSLEESKMVKNSRIEVLKGCGHLGMLEAPQKSVDLLLEHINEINF